MKTSHFEGRIALSAADAAQRRDESTQRELATFNNNLGSAWLVPAADCA
jgi:zona occludens toxin (predicted ATPase)